MQLDSHKRKQIIIAVIFFVIIGALGFLIFRAVLPPKIIPTPNPTANLLPIQVIYSKLFNIQNNDYDFLAKVRNPNNEYGSGDVSYEIEAYDSSDKLISSRDGNFYILPGQTKYVILTPLRFTPTGSRVEFMIKTIAWEKLDPLSAGGSKLITKNVDCSSIAGPNLFAKVGGSVANASDFDFDIVDVSVVAFDGSGEPVAVGRTDIRTFLSKTERGFEVSWFSPFVGQVTSVDAEATTNVFNNLNFIRRFSRQQRFQQRY